MFDLSLAGASLSTAYPERKAEAASLLDRIANRAMGPMIRVARRRRAQQTDLPDRVAREGEAFQSLDDAQLKRVADELRVELRRTAFGQEAVARSFALVREVAGRTLGMRHFDCQLLGGSLLLRGLVAEMETGEGKTLTATLPACTVALAGVPVHIVTVNDYLAQRDAEWMGPLYRALGLTVGIVVHGMSLEARQAAYACDVTYCTNKEIAFDYLKDRLVLGRHQSRLQLQLERLTGAPARMRRLMLRGLCYAIVDEADSVLIDEARTPLIIAGGDGNAPQQRAYENALEFAAQLTTGRDFVC